MLIELFSKKKLRAVFFGTPEFAVPSLEACSKLFDLIGAVTQPDRPRGRGQKVSPCPVKEVALKLGLPTFSPESLKKDSNELQNLNAFLKKTKPDIFVVLAYGNLLPNSILDLPRLGAVNLHASLLPRWRGAAPIQRAIEAGDNSTGVCLQKMVQKLDAGDVLFEKKYLIDSLANAEAVSHGLSKLSAEVLSEYFSKHFKRKLEGRAQDESFVTLASKISKDEAAWSPEWTAIQTHNRVRAFYVWPQVRATISSGESIAITKTTLNGIYNGKPIAAGQIVLSDGRVYLGSASSNSLEPVLELLEIKPANKGTISAWDYFQNHAGQETLTLK
jgi:methionyl-tRNA formyltransferase